MASCRDTATFGIVALDDDLPQETTEDLAEHLRECRACSAYLTQTATTSSIVAMRHRSTDEFGHLHEAVESGTAGDLGAGDDRATARTQRLLLALARAADPLHAEDLVQDTWQHLLDASPSKLPTRTELSDHLLGHIRNHGSDDGAEHAQWADALLRTYRHQPTDLSEADVPLVSSRTTHNTRGPSAHEFLDSDSDNASVFYPDFYDDGPLVDTWVNPPTAWPSVTRVLGPDAELDTTELYSAVDSALEELPPIASDVVQLVDLEGHSLNTAAILLGVNLEDARAALVEGRTHLRGRINDHLAV